MGGDRENPDIKTFRGLISALTAQNRATPHLRIGMRLGDWHRRHRSHRHCSQPLRIDVSARSPAIMLANDHEQDHLASNDDEDHHVNMQEEEQVFLCGRSLSLSSCSV
jgi:hypothetical protein